MKPFLRWAGGKNWLIKELDNLLPPKIENYFEPFLGGGSVFLFLKSKGLVSKKLYLSDSNRDLINAYKVVKNNLPCLILAINEFSNTEQSYYSIRDKHFDNDVQNAAKFIYLNRTSFNGIYRVNKKGIYNVPYGRRKLREIIEEDVLFEISNNLKGCYFSVGDFKKIRNKVMENDFIFFDPPYTLAHENNGFIHYNQSLFSWKNQVQLAKLTSEITRRNAHFLLTNAAHSSIYNLYSKCGNINTLSRPSTIGGKGAKRTNYNEIALKNY